MDAEGSKDRSSMEVSSLVKKVMKESIGSDPIGSYGLPADLDLYDFTFKDPMQKKLAEDLFSKSVDVLRELSDCNNKDSQGEPIILGDVTKGIRQYLSENISEIDNAAFRTKFFSKKRAKEYEDMIENAGFVILKHKNKQLVFFDMESKDRYMEAKDAGFQEEKRVVPYKRYSEKRKLLYDHLASGFDYQKKANEAGVPKSLNIFSSQDRTRNRNVPILRESFFSLIQGFVVDNLDDMRFIYQQEIEDAFLDYLIDVGFDTNSIRQNAGAVLNRNALGDEMYTKKGARILNSKISDIKEVNVIEGLDKRLRAFYVDPIDISSLYNYKRQNTPLKRNNHFMF